MQIPDHLEKSLVNSLVILLSYVALTREKNETNAAMLHRAATIVGDCMQKAAQSIKNEIKKV